MFGMQRMKSKEAFHRWWWLSYELIWTISFPTQTTEKEKIFLHITSSQSILLLELLADEHYLQLIIQKWSLIIKEINNIFYFIIISINDESIYLPRIQDKIFQVDNYHVMNLEKCPETQNELCWIILFSKKINDGVDSSIKFRWCWKLALLKPLCSFHFCSLLTELWLNYLRSDEMLLILEFSAIKLYSWVDAQI
jgi:hypothetical protein